MELTIEDVRMLLGQYVIEMYAKDKEIARLKKELEERTQDKDVVQFPKEKAN